MIRDLIVEGASRFDQRDPDGMADTYTDDAVLTAATGERAEGKRAILPATGKSFEVSGVESARVRTANSSNTTCTGTLWA